MVAVAIAATVAFLAETGGTALAAPPHPAAPPSVNAGPAVRGVTAVPSHFAHPANPAAGVFRPTATHVPAPATSNVTLGAQGERVHATGTPVWTEAVASVGHAPGRLAVRVFDQQTADAAGVRGVLIGVNADVAGQVRFGVDYGSFAQAYGGNYGSRLALFSYPSCVLTTPALPSCHTATPLASVNDRVHDSVSGQVGVTAASPQSANGAATPMTVLALAASGDVDGGGAGSYSATDLKPSGSWTAGGSTGSLSYRYPLVVAQASTSLVPELALSYDSSSVDGRTASTQAQASWVGEGWETPHSYIEQSFISCSGKPEGTDSPVSTQDMCYDGPILMMSLNGSSSALVWDATKSVWKPEHDDGSVVTHVTNSGNGQGTYNTDYWNVTTRDGTVYSFGMNHLPGWTAGKPATNSVDSEPVYSAHNNGIDPCYNATWSLSWCTMGYRWNLDYVKDTHGNAMAYYYSQDTNFYGRNNGATMTSYVRDSHLAHIDYGFVDSQAYATIPDTIVFTTGDRCLSGTCQPLNSANKANWPDVPFDLICASGATCTSWSPSFFSTVRLITVASQQYSTATSSYTTVDSYALSHTMPPTGDTTSPTLWLSQVVHTGSDLAGGGSTSSITMPALTFGGIALQNRVDTVTDGLPAYYKYRLATITTESGSQITVSYGLTNPCTAPVTITPSANTSSCYPVMWTPTGYSQPFTDWFNKYVVTGVSQTDPTGGAQAVNTTYQYVGGAAWHFDDNELVKPANRTYGQFRGYGDVKTLTGNGSPDPQALSETTYYRGMSKNNNTTVINVTDSQGGVHEDVNQLAGNALESTAYLGNGGPVDNSTVNSYWVSAASATRTRTGLADLTANWVAPAEVWSRQALTASGPTTWRTSETDTSYLSDPLSTTFGTVQHVYTHSTPAAAASDRCTTTSYAQANAAKNLVGLPAEVETDAVACGGYAPGSPASVPGSLNTLTAPASVSRPSQVVSEARTFYDDTTWSLTFPQVNPPSKGDVTMVREARDYTAGDWVWQTKKRSAYDSYGNQIDAYNGNGQNIHTAYTRNSVGLTTAMAITNPLGQQVTSTLEPQRRLTLTATDANGVVTTEQYDALGRLSSVWTNSRATTLPANYKYTYVISNAGLSSTTTQKMNDGAGYQTTTLIYDAMLRPRQTQSNTPQGGRIITDTFYDSRGWKSSTYNGWWDPTTLPNTILVSAAALHDSVPSQDFYTLDGLGRTVIDVSAKDGTEISRTTTVYNGDRKTVIPPAGGVTETTITDPLGRTSELDQYISPPTLNTPANTFTGIFTVSGGTTQVVSYGYDSRGQQGTVAQGALGSGAPTWTTSYDLLNEVTSKTDADAGTSVMSYDGDGNLTQVTEARSKTTSYTYDALDRKTGQYDSAANAQLPGPTGNQIAAWVYDNSNNVAGVTHAIGQLTTATAYRGGSTYTKQEKNFNVFGESTGATITIPASEGTLAGSYTFLQTYSTNTGLALKDIYPLAGGLPSETVNHGYSGVLDLPDTLGGLSGYSQGTTYDAFGRVNQQTLGTGTNLAYVSNTFDSHTGRLTDQLLTRAVGTPTNVNEEAYTYDLAGNVTRQVSTRLGSASTSETQCYGYDNLDQLTAAWTATDNCAATPTTASHAMVGDNLGSSSAYWTTWSIDNLGDRTQQIQHAFTGGPATDTTTAYCYGATGGAQPHTLTATATTGAGCTTSATTYSYDAAGNMATRSAGQGSQTFQYNDADQLTAINGSTGGNSTYVYGADGSLLLQKDPGTTILYLGPEQLVLNTSTNVVTGARYYQIPGGGSVVRTGTGTNYKFAISDRHASPVLYLDSTAQTPTWRQFTPYGEARGSAVTAPDNHGFLNKLMDTNTGLTIVGARQYDPATGRFATDDPLLETTDPCQLNGYGYGGNNPMSYADPTGLARELGPGADRRRIGPTVTWTRQCAASWLPTSCRMVPNGGGCQTACFPSGNGTGGGTPSSGTQTGTDTTNRTVTDTANLTALDLLNDFEAGKGGNYIFTNDSFFAQQIRKDWYMVTINNQIMQAVRAGHTNGSGAKSLGDWETFIKESTWDGPNLASYITGWGDLVGYDNLEMTYLGSYNYTWRVVQDYGSAKAFRVEITIHNVTTVESGTRIPGLGYSNSGTNKTIQNGATQVLGPLLYGSTDLPAQTQTITISEIFSTW
jgi:RHS repeat-associated protein